MFAGNKILKYTHNLFMIFVLILKEEKNLLL